MVRASSTLWLIAFASVALAVPTSGVLAQQKQKVSFKATTENTKYTQQLNLEVGNLPNHFVRAFEIHRTYPTNPPVINDLKLVEMWERGLVDIVDGNGSVTQYGVYVVENGDKFFTRSSGVVLSDGTGKVTADDAGTITGGTGRLATMQGTIRVHADIDRKTGFNETRDEIEYTIGK